MFYERKLMTFFKYSFDNFTQNFKNYIWTNLYLKSLYWKLLFKYY